MRTFYARYIFCKCTHMGIVSSRWPAMLLEGDIYSARGRASESRGGGGDTIDDGMYATCRGVDDNLIQGGGRSPIDRCTNAKIEV